MHITVKQLRKMLEDVPDDDTKIIFWTKDVCRFAKDAFLTKLNDEQFFVISDED